MNKLLEVAPEFILLFTNDYSLFTAIHRIREAQTIFRNAIGKVDDMAIKV
ncbi:MAG: hypothetical protein NT178_03890 [Proteobacteria bacterium]|nr:hypothetical protein [Pseudomonadota bacterium]